MFFSAEEGGLLGSGEVAKSYREEGKKVKAMFHMYAVVHWIPLLSSLVSSKTDNNVCPFSKPLHAPLTSIYSSSIPKRDVVAYVKPGTTPVIGLITDGVSDDLTEYMKLLIDEYAQIPYGKLLLTLSVSLNDDILNDYLTGTGNTATTQCGYGCSDFASFTKNGFRSTCLAEGKFADSNPK